MSGYCPCACRDCFDITITSDDSAFALCWECEEAGCDASGESECERFDAYGCEDDDESEGE